MSEIEKLKAELDKCIKAHDELVTINKSFQDILNKVEPGLEKLNSENEDLLEQLNKQIDERNKWQSRCYKYEAMCERLARASLVFGDSNFEGKYIDRLIVMDKALKDYDQFKKDMDR